MKTMIVVGGKREVHFISKSFEAKGYRVVIVNNDLEACRSLAHRHEKVQVVHGDGTHPDVLADAGAGHAELVVALTGKDQDNLVVAQLAKKVFNVRHTFALVNNPESIEIFKKLGIDSVFSTVDTLSSLIEQKINVEDIQHIMPVGEGRMAMMEITLAGDSPVIGKKLSEIPVSQEALVGCVFRKEHTLIPRGETIILEGDRLLVLSLPSAQSEVLKLLRGRVD